MKNIKNSSSIQLEVMNKIQNGSVKMKPRIYFTLLWLFGIFATIAASLTFAYLISMLIYIIRIQTADTPAYGARQNLSESIATFPWWIAILTIIFSIIAFVLLKNHSRIYRYKISYIVLIFILISFLIGFGLSFAEIGHSNKVKMEYNGSNNHLQDGSGRGRGQRN